LRRLYWPTIASLTIRAGGVTRTLRRSPWRTTIDVGTLSRPRFAVRITAVTSTGRTVRGTRRYRTCAVDTG
jgi:hypothetical protein